jgi:hypothetical protein
MINSISMSQDGRPSSVYLDPTAVCPTSLPPDQHSQGKTRKPKHHIQETESLRSIPSAA